MFAAANGVASSSSSTSSTSGGGGSGSLRAARRADLARHRRQRLALQQQSRRSLSSSAADALTAPLAAMSEQTCKYKSGKCSNPRATKRNGQLHTLCSFHRMRQNEHQRKSDRKHRLINVSRRAKLGSFGLGADAGGHQSLHSILSLASAFPGVTPGGLLRLHAHDQNTPDAFRNSHYAVPAGDGPHGAAGSAGAGGGGGVGGVGSPLPGLGAAVSLNGRLPPISYLTGNLDGYRASSAIPALSRRS